MVGRGDQHVEDLDHGESIRAPTQRHKLIHATVLSVPVGPPRTVSPRRRLRSIDATMTTGFHWRPTTEE